MRMSENINEIAAALSKAQAVMKPAVFNRTNPHFRSKFADLNSCMDACKQALADNGLCIMQLPEQINGKDILVTMLAHSSGQWITSEYPLLADKMNSQGFGSAMTYAKRYSLCAMLGIVADEDDDGEATIDRTREKEKAPDRPHAFQMKAEKLDDKKEAIGQPLMSEEQANELEMMSENCPAEAMVGIRKYMQTQFKTQQFKDCPAFSYTSFRSSMASYSKKEKAV